jgi:hypothetical protein
MKLAPSSCGDWALENKEKTMAIKNVKAVERYVSDVAAIMSMLENLKEFAESLPAPDDDETLPTLHYEHIGCVAEIRLRLAESMDFADTFSKI